VWAVPRAELEATVAAYERVAATAPREVSAELRAERLAEANARARALELRARDQAELAAQAEARADAGNVRATELESAAGVYASWEESTAPQRAAAELARAELDRRGATRPQLPEREPELAAGESTPEADREDLEMETTAGDLEAAVAQLPELDTTSVSPATEARVAELANRKAAQAEADADEAQRRANRAAYTAAELAAPEPEAPSAWVQGLATPEWGGPPSRTPAAEASWRPVCKRQHALYGAQGPYRTLVFGRSSESQAARSRRTSPW
jgi:fused signal recognition particle receptor